MLNFFHFNDSGADQIDGDFNGTVFQLDSGADEPEFLSQNNIYNIKLQ